MPLDLARFIRTRPVLYHLTASSNLQQIRTTMNLQPTSRLLEKAGRMDLARARRRESQVVSFNGTSIHIRDQAPLHAGNVALAPGWSFEDLVVHLNEHVFFWPGTKVGPISYGRRHFQRYLGDDNVVLKLPTAQLFRTNTDLGPRFCKYNSGSPRCNGGHPSPRGPSTFVHAAEFGGTPSAVVEVTFRGSVTLAGCDLAVVDPCDCV